MINVDTHILVYALSGAVTAKERRVLAGDTWSVSGVVFWELAKVVQLGRLQIDLEEGEVVRTLSNLHVWPIDLAVSLQSTGLDFAADPADDELCPWRDGERVPYDKRRNV